MLFFLYWFLVENQPFDTSLMVTFKVMPARIQEDCDNPTTMNIVLLVRGSRRTPRSPS